MTGTTNKIRILAMTLALVLIISFTMPFQKVNAAAQTPITRSEVENRALSMINLQWNYSSAKNGTIDPKYTGAVTTPKQLAGITSGQAVGIPYDWGGLDSPYTASYNAPWTSFLDAISKGAYAGNVNTDGGYGLVPGTAGIDCSGFVQAAFNIKDYKLSTSTIFNSYFKQIPLSDIKHMDILNKPGDHVVIFDKWGTFNGIEGAYTYEATPDQTRGGIQGTKKYFISMNEISKGYIPGRYVNIVEESTVALPHPVEVGVFAQISNVTTAASLRASAGSTTQVGTVPKGTIAYMINYSNGWYQMSYNGQVGWVWGEFISAIPSGKYVTVSNTTSLNIRTSPSLTGTIIGTISKNQYAEVLGYSADGNWYKISLNGVVGWSSKSYLSYIY